MEFAKNLFYDRCIYKAVVFSSLAKYVSKPKFSHDTDVVNNYHMLPVWDYKYPYHRNNTLNCHKATRVAFYVT